MMDGYGTTPEEAIGQPRRTALVLALPDRRRLLRFTLWVGAPLLVAGLILNGTGLSYRAASFAPLPPPPPKADAAASLKRDASKLRSERRALEATLQQKLPKSTYIIIDQTHNRLTLKRDDETILTAKCSAGSGMVLQEGGGKNRKWIFDTPRGQYRVRERVANPIWKKPDWAFVEEGQPIPRDPEERFERGTLGEYALHLGNGYMIHGTLYERLLGRSVTHGCIRLGRDDLRVVWANAPIGTPVYIY